MDDSEASNSSIIISNSSEEALATHVDNDDADNNYSLLSFDILKRDLSLEARESLTTKELFPEKSGFLKPLLETKPTQQWLGLARAVEEEEDREADMKIFHQKQQVKKSRRGPRSRSSQYRGVTFYRRTGRWESHIWDCGKQVYLGGFDTAHAAARAYDRAAIRFRGVDADINFNLADYEDDLKQTRNLSKEEFVHILRRQSTGFARGNSKIKGASLQKSTGWESRSAATESLFSRETSSHNLDLTLGISLPPHEAADTSSSARALHGLPLTRQSIPTWPGLMSNCQKGGKVEIAGWPWQPLGNQSEVPPPPLPAAASSGFSPHFIYAPSAAVSDARNRFSLHHFYP